MRATTIPRFPDESRLYTGSIFRPLLDSKTRIGSQGYVLSDGMGSSSFFLLATWIRFVWLTFLYAESPY